MSSRVVAVECESWADELLLCGGEGRLNKPSLPLAPGPLDIAADPPLPLRRLGELPVLYVNEALGPRAPPFAFLLKVLPSKGPGTIGPESLLVGVIVLPPEFNGLGGKLDVRMPRGGCGNEFMLIVLRTVFPAALTPAVCLGFCKLFGIGMLGSWVWLPPEGARSPLLSKCVECPDVSTVVGIPPWLFLVLFVGIAGSAPEGGPKEGLAERGNDVVDIVVRPFSKLLCPYCIRVTSSASCKCALR